MNGMPIPFKNWGEKKNSKLNPQLSFWHVVFKKLLFFPKGIDLPERFPSEWRCCDDALIASCNKWRMRCPSCSFGFFLWQLHVIHFNWRVYNWWIYWAADMQAKKKLSKPHIRQTKAQIITFWAKRRTISILSGIFSQWDWIICTQTNWNKSKRNEGQWVSGIKRNISVDMFFFRPSSKKNEFHFFFDYRNMRAFNFETFFRYSTAVFAHLTISIDLLFSFPKANFR